MLTQRPSADEVSDLAGDENDPRHGPQSAAAGSPCTQMRDLLYAAGRTGNNETWMARAWELD